MKREDITKIFEGATDEQINAVLDINSSDIGKAKQKLEVERDSYKTQLETAQTALKEFEGVDVGELKGKIAQLTADLERSIRTGSSIWSFNPCRTMHLLPAVQETLRQ